MIISQINSGLGNQMFQYAAGKSLSVYRKTDLILDISWYQNTSVMQTPRTYELDVFNLDEQLIKEDAAFNYYRQGNILLNKIINKIERNIPYYKRKLFEEQHFHFDTNFFKGRKDCILSGYWQSEKYFENISELIKTKFTCTENDWGKEDINLLKLIDVNNSVSLHVRRGDMILNPEVSKIHRACDLNYYLNAISYMERKLMTPVFFIFSDDTEWAKQNIVTSNQTFFVDHNKNELAWLDMQLMSRCKHNIIANSSFSWWGAWLNRNINKTVIAPQKWFNHNNNNTKDLLPSSWIKL